MKTSEPSTVQSSVVDSCLSVFLQLQWPTTTEQRIGIWLKPAALTFKFPST